MNRKKNFFILFLLNFNIIYLEENNLRSYNSTGMGEVLPYQQILESQEENNLKSYHSSGTGEVSHQQIVESQKAVMESVKLDTIQGALTQAVNEINTEGPLYQALVSRFATIPQGLRNSQFRSFYINGKRVDFSQAGQNLFKNVAITDFLILEDQAGVAGDLAIYPDLAEPTPAVFFVDSLTGDTKVGGSLNVVGDFRVNTNRFTVDDVTGNTAVAGTLNVTGATALSSTLRVTGGTTLSSTLGVAGNTTVGGTLGVAGDFAVNTNKFTVDDVTGNTAVAGTLNVSGGTTFASTLDVARGITINEGGLIINDDSHSLLAQTTIKDALNLEDAWIIGDIFIAPTYETEDPIFIIDSSTGNVATEGNLYIQGTSTLVGNVNCSQDLRVSGNLLINRTSTLVGSVNCFNNFEVYNESLDQSIIKIDNSMKNINIESNNFNTEANLITIDSPLIEVNKTSTGCGANINIGRRTSSMEIEGSVIFDDGVTFNGPLNINGSGFLSINNLQIGSGNLTVNSNKFVVAGPTGDTTIGGLLTADNGFVSNDSANFNCNVSMTGPVSINTGTSNYNTTIGSNSNYVYINGRTQFGAAMTFNEPVTMNNSVNVTSSINLPNTVSINFSGVTNPSMTDYSSLIQASDNSKNLKFATYNSIWNMFQEQVGGVGSIDSSDYVLVIESGDGSNTIKKVQISSLPPDISSRKFKENIEKVDLNNDVINLLSCYSFNYIPTIKKGRKAYGFIAEDLIDTPLDFAITYDNNGEIEGIDYNSLFVALFSVYKNKISDQDEDMKKLQKENSSLKKKLDNLSNELNVIKKFFNDFCDKKFSY